MRNLGRSGIEVSEIGFGAWAIGGPFSLDGRPAGWGEVDDEESIAAIHQALDLGVTFFDTADVYGTGRSERVLARALEGHRDEVVIATKFGHTYVEATRELTGSDISPEYIRRACQASLKRLRTDRIDLYQLHDGGIPFDQVDGVLATLEDLVAEGLIRSYGWSTDDPERAAAFAKGTHCTAVQHVLNVLSDAPEMLAVCAAHDLASVNRGPLAMGLLSGKYNAGSQLPGDDVRIEANGLFFQNGRPLKEYLAKLEDVREVLTSGGRTLTQGALGWLLARDSRTVPIPGIRTAAQATENFSALRLGPLDPAQMTEIAELLS